MDGMERDGLTCFYFVGLLIYTSLLIFNIFHAFSNVSIVDFEQVNISWDTSTL